MSLERPRTGHERNPDEFRFSGLKIPPDAVLPPALRKLTAELRAHQQKHRDAEQKHGELTHPNTLRTAQQSDALLLGEAVRNDQDDPGPVDLGSELRSFTDSGPSSLPPPGDVSADGGRGPAGAEAPAHRHTGYGMEHTWDR